MIYSVAKELGKPLSFLFTKYFTHEFIQLNDGSIPMKRLCCVK